ncbi:hypothetical protein QFC22_003061 [Naganishia vaughanmartiniae]|uniref:Uncharacterized protein n=1 Tax=Naganishia vaughanmartiniae TaxID=1424756 RepID=A0ACC2XA31_9TREE|nr:hypothetical protein QFC22_003061 [Naganishia vaughanmartiniae]
MHKIEKQTDWTDGAVSSPFKFEDWTGQTKLLANKSAHKRHLQRIERFLFESPVSIDASQEIQDTQTKAARPDTLVLSDEFLSFEPSSMSATSRDTVVQANHPIARVPATTDVSERPAETSIAQTRLKTLADWRSMTLSDDKKDHLEVLVPLIISFQACGFDQPAIYQTALGMLQSLKNASLHQECNSNIQEILQYTQRLVVNNQDTSRTRYQTATTGPLGVDLTSKEKVSRWIKAFEAMEAFRLRYPDPSLSPSEGEVTRKPEPAPVMVTRAEPPHRQEDAEVRSLPQSASPEELSSRSVDVSTTAPIYGFSGDGLTLRSLSCWERLPFSAEEREKLNLILKPILLFQSYKFIESSTLQEPLRIANLLARSRSMEHRSSFMLDLVSHAHAVIADHLQSLREQQKEYNSKIKKGKRDELAHCKQMLGQLNKIEAVTAKFLLRYPLASTSTPSIGGTEKQDAAVLQPDEPNTTVITSDMPRASAQSSRKPLQLTQWRSIDSLSAAGMAVLEICIPVFLSHRNAGISESKDYTILPELLSELGTLEPGDARDSRLQALLSMTDRFIVANQQALLRMKHLNDEEGLKSKLKGRRIDIRFRIANAMSMAARFRERYPLGGINNQTSVSSGVQISDQHHLPIIVGRSSIPSAVGTQNTLGRVALGQREPLERPIEAHRITTTGDDGNVKRKRYLYEEDQITIRKTLYSCRRAGLTEPQLYREALEALHAIDLLADPVDKGSKTQDLWHKVQRLIQVHMDNIKEQNQKTQSATSSDTRPTNLTKRSRLVVNKSVHGRHLERIHRFLGQNPRSTNALQEGQDTALKSRRSASLLPIDESSNLTISLRGPTPGSISVGDALMTETGVPIEVPRLTTQKSIVKSGFENLAKWEYIDMSSGEKSHLEILLPVILSFRSCDIGQPTIHWMPLQLLQSFTNASSKAERNGKIQELVRYTHELVQQHEKRLHTQHRAATLDVDLENDATSKEIAARWTKVFEVTEIFRLHYPSPSMSATSATEIKKLEEVPPKVAHTGIYSDSQDEDRQLLVGETSMREDLNQSDNLATTSAQGSSCHSVRLTSLYDWKDTFFPIQEEEKLRLILAPLLHFRDCGFGRPSDLEEPLRIWNLLSQARSEGDRHLYTRNLVRFTHIMIHQHSDSLRDQQSQFASKIAESEGEQLSGRNSHLGQINRAVAAVAEFLLRFPSDHAHSTSLVKAENRDRTVIRPVDSPKAKTMTSDMPTASVKANRKRIPLSEWRTVTSLTPAEMAVLEICISVYLSYRNSGISKSRVYAVLPELLWELGNSSPGHIRCSKMHDLISVTDEFIIANHKILIRTKRPNDTGAVKTAIGIKYDKGQIAKAVAATTSFRQKYPLGSIKNGRPFSGESPGFDLSDSTKVKEGATAGQGKYVAPIFANKKLPLTPAPSPTRPGKTSWVSELKRVQQVEAYNSMAAYVTNRLRAISKILPLSTQQTKMFVRRLRIATRVRGTQRLLYPFKSPIFKRRRVGFTRADQTKANNQACPTAPITDWRAQGFHDYGHWLSSKLHELTPREAAHIIHLSSPSTTSSLSKAGPHTEWVTSLQAKFKDLEQFGEEVNDRRINIHLKEFAVTGDLSINDSGELQRNLAKALHVKLIQTSSAALQVATDASFKVYNDGRSEAGGGILVESDPPIRDMCYMGQHIVSSGSAELAALLRGLQIVRDILNSPAAQTSVGQYRRIIFVTDAIMSLQALTSSNIFQDSSETQRMTRIAALCRMAAHDILRHNHNIASIHFTWLPRKTGGNTIADKLAESGRYSGTEFIGSS